MTENASTHNMKIHQKDSKWPKMAKNRQKSAKFIRKIDFPYNTSLSVQKCTKKKIAFGEKKNEKKIAPAALYRCDPPGCYRISGFWNSGILPLYLSLADGLV